MAAKKEKRYVIADPEADMTKNQSYALYNMCGVDVRGVDLTKGQASELIDAAKNGGAKTVRLALSQVDGALVKRREVHKNFRAEKNPTGYKGIEVPAAKKKAPAKKAAPESDDDDIGLTQEAMKKLAAKDPAQLIALLTGEPLADPEPKAKPKKTQPKKTNTPTARKRAAAAKAKDEKEEPEDDATDKVAQALKDLVAEDVV